MDRTERLVGPLVSLALHGTQIGEFPRQGLGNASRHGILSGLARSNFGSIDSCGAQILDLAEKLGHRLFECVERTRAVVAAVETLCDEIELALQFAEERRFAGLGTCRIGFAGPGGKAGDFGSQPGNGFVVMRRRRDRVDLVGKTRDLHLQGVDHRGVLCRGRDTVQPLGKGGHVAAQIGSDRRCVLQQAAGFNLVGQTLQLRLDCLHALRWLCRCRVCQTIRDGLQQLFEPWCWHDSRAWTFEFCGEIAHQQFERTGIGCRGRCRRGPGFDGFLNRIEPACEIIEVRAGIGCRDCSLDAPAEVLDLPFDLFQRERPIRDGRYQAANVVGPGQDLADGAGIDAMAAHGLKLAAEIGQVAFDVFDGCTWRNFGE